MTVIIVLGTLTHYYFLVYLFWCCVVWGIRLIWHRSWKELGIFLGIIIFSGGVCIAVFPAMINHIFKGYRGTQSMDALLHSSFVENARFYITGINDICGGFLSVILLAAVLFLFLLCYKRKILTALGCWAIVLFPSVLYFVTICKISPMEAIRYISPVYGSCMILVIGLLIKMERVCAKRLFSILTVVVIGILLVNSWRTYTWPDLNKGRMDIVELARQYGSSNECIYVFDSMWKVYPNYEELVQYKNITFVSPDNWKLLHQPQYQDYDSVMMYFDYAINEESREEIINGMLAQNPKLTEYSKAYEYCYSQAFYLQ